MPTILASGMAMLRITLGITQQELAGTLGVSRSLVAMAERGDRKLPQRCLEYLHQLYGIVQRMPTSARLIQNERPGIPRIRKPYNRVPFSARRGKPAPINIVTGRVRESVLSAEEIRATGERLRERCRKEGNCQPGSAEARRELMETLANKSDVTRARIDYLELDVAMARTRGQDLAAGLTLIKAQLKVSRQIAREHPSQRKRFRRKIAVLFVKKLYQEHRLEKFNRPAILKRKELIAGLRSDLDKQRELYEAIKQRMKEMG